MAPQSRLSGLPAIENGSDDGDSTLFQVAGHVLEHWAQIAAEQNVNSDGRRRPVRGRGHALLYELQRGR